MLTMAAEYGDTAMVKHISDDLEKQMIWDGGICEDAPLVTITRLEVSSGPK